MTERPHLSSVPPGADQDDAVTVVLFVNSALYAESRSGPTGRHIADALTTLSNGDLNAALGSTLSAMLDLTASGSPGVAAEALSAALELVHRITTARTGMRAGL